MMQRVRVKFCGMMRPQDAVAAAAAGADAIGMILHAPGARRLIDPHAARAVVAALPPYVAAVGVFVDATANAAWAIATEARVDIIQLHGSESIDDVHRLAPFRVVKAFKAHARLADELVAWRDAVRRGKLPNLIGLLIDSPAGGGTGVPNDFDGVRRLVDQNAFVGLPPLILAGGLTPENVGGAVAKVRPFAVDASSGIEAQFGEKSADLMNAFVRAVSVPSPGTPGEG